MLAVENGYANLNLNTLWFALIAFLWIGFFFLEGFDFGVGMLLPFLSKDDTDRRVIINTIGPVWDGNEVWLIVAGGATFAAFPNWYATFFSGLYIPLFLILAALIFRGVAFEFRGKDRRPAWRAWWDRALFWGSLFPSVLFGIAFANILRGVPIAANGEFTGSLLGLLNPYALTGGLATFALFTLHGAAFLALKTEGEVRERARAAGRGIGLLAAVVALVFFAWTLWSAARVDDRVLVPGIIAVAAVLACVLAAWLLRQGRDGRAFIATGLSTAFLMTTIFVSLYPRVMVSSLGPANDLTIWNSSSTPRTLGLMTIVAVIFTPVVLAYQGWTYWVFRKRLRREDIPAAGGAQH